MAGGLLIGRLGPLVSSASEQPRTGQPSLIDSADSEFVALSRKNRSTVKVTPPSEARLDR